VSSRNEVYLEG